MDKNMYYKAARKLDVAYEVEYTNNLKWNCKDDVVEVFACNTIEASHRSTSRKPEDSFAQIFAPTHGEWSNMQTAKCITRKIPMWTNLLECAFFSSGKIMYSIDPFYDRNCRVFALLLMQEMIDNP